MILAASSWISRRQLRQTQCTGAHHKQHDDAAVNDGHWSSLEDGEKHRCGHTGPTIADVETGGEDLQGANCPRWSCNFAEDFILVIGGCDRISAYIFNLSCCAILRSRELLRLPR